jgi:hypothetical protein
MGKRQGLGDAYKSIRNEVIEEILPNLYKVEIPLPDNPLKTLNSSVIKELERNLIMTSPLLV